jgi:hypothetical protein
MDGVVHAHANFKINLQEVIGKTGTDGSEILRWTFEETMKF